MPHPCFTTAERKFAPQFVNALVASANSGLALTPGAAEHSTWP